MNRIKQLLDERGILQKQFALDIGVSQPTVSDWVNNRKDPRHENLSKVANYFGVTANEIKIEEIPNTAITIEAGQDNTYSTLPHTPEGMTILGVVDKMPAADRKKALDLMRVVFAQYEDFFKEG